MEDEARTESASETGVAGGSVAVQAGETCEVGVGGAGSETAGAGTAAVAGAGDRIRPTHLPAGIIIQPVLVAAVTLAVGKSSRQDPRRRGMGQSYPCRPHRDSSKRSSDYVALRWCMIGIGRFQWVTQAADASEGALSASGEVRKLRRLHVGNLPALVVAEGGDQLLSSAIWNELKARGMPLTGASRYEAGESCRVEGGCL